MRVNKESKLNTGETFEWSVWIYETRRSSECHVVLGDTKEEAKKNALSRYEGKEDDIRNIYINGPIQKFESRIWEFEFHKHFHYE